MNEIVLPGDIDAGDVYAFLTKAVDAYTGSGSTSVPIETAKELLEGICHHIRVGSGADVYSRYESGIEIAREKALRALRRYNCLIATASDYGNITLRDTLKGLGVFFKRYDPKLFPLETPGDIDYQLASPLPCGLAGADYMLEYARRLMIEERFTGRYKESDVTALLRLYNPECDQLAINVFDMVFANCVGKAMLGVAGGKLIMTKKERDAVINTLYMRSKEYIYGETSKAVSLIQGAFNMQNADSEWYLSLARDSLCDRLYQSLGYSRDGEKCELFLFE